MHWEESTEHKISGNLNNFPLGLCPDPGGDGRKVEDGGDGGEEGRHGGDQSV